MKKYRLREDTALYPKGTIAEWCVNSHSYHIYDTDKMDSYMELMPWQIEENKNWELLEWIHKSLEGETSFISAEDQREEEVVNNITPSMPSMTSSPEDQREEVGGSTSGLDGCEKMNKLIEHLDHLNINYVIHSDYHVRIDGIIDAYPTTGKFFHKGLEYSTWYYNTNEVIEEVYRLRNQREMECRHPIETLRQYDDKNVARMECGVCGKKPVLHVNLKNHHIGEEDKKLDHQALREESLKEKGAGYEVQIVGECAYFTVRVHKEYADAWRALLNKKEG